MIGVQKFTRYAYILLVLVVDYFAYEVFTETWEKMMVKMDVVTIHVKLIFFVKRWHVVLRLMFM
jgi:hypothetical protein